MLHLYYSIQSNINYLMDLMDLINCVTQIANIQKVIFNFKVLISRDKMKQPVVHLVDQHHCSPEYSRKTYMV